MDLDNLIPTLCYIFGILTQGAGRTLIDSKINRNNVRVIILVFFTEWDKGLGLDQTAVNYLGKQNFSLGSFPEVGQKQRRKRKKRERERLNDGNNNGQLRIANATSGSINIMSAYSFVFMKGSQP